MIPEHVPHGRTVDSRLGEYRGRAGFVTGTLKSGMDNPSIFFTVYIVDMTYWAAACSSSGELFVY